MKKLARIFWVVCCIASLSAITGPSPIGADEVFITIGGGDPSGVYFPAGLAIVKLLNQRRAQYGIRATVEATTGSIFNLNAIMAGYLEFGLVQSDRQYEAFSGLAEWEKTGPQKELRAVFSLHQEALTLVTAQDTGITGLMGLKGKRVSSGNPGASPHQIVKDVLGAVGLELEKDIINLKVMASNAPTLLQDRHIDAFFFTVGHPSETIRKALSIDRRARILSISGPAIDQLIAEQPKYVKAMIPVGRLYPQAAGQEDVVTLGVTATLCTSIRVPEQVVYALTREVFENFELFRRQHPAFYSLTRENMLMGLSAPLHPGAVKYFKESGLMP